MSTQEWIVQDCRIAEGMIHGTIQRSGDAKESAEPVEIPIQPPSAQEQRHLLNSLSASAQKVYLLLRDVLREEAGENENGSSSVSSSLLSAIGLEYVHELPADATVAEVLSACTPYLHTSEGLSAYYTAGADLQIGEQQIQTLLAHAWEQLHHQPLLAWHLSGWSTEKLLREIWQQWGQQLPAPAEWNISEQEDEAVATLSDEPSLGSLLAESAAAGTLHQLGEGLTEVEEYLQNANKSWQQQLKKNATLVVYTPSPDEETMPDLQTLLPEVKGAMDGYEEVRRKVADRIRQRHVSRQSKK
ncbi:hypothetical protein [Paenibacillus dauci]|uniref:hypothetical protein n=1 Tax=Paenibacillus dauci TaxID=1567106 RepID=UPI000619E203|nr:hypothetical protein [Paenibacillus dauci]